METVKPRLNPFLFPPDTNFRFVLLIISVLGASLFAYNNLYNQLHRQELFTSWSKCFSEAEATYPLQGLDPTASEYIDRSYSHNRFINECIEPTEQSQARWMLLWLALLLLVTAVIYWFIPAVRIQRGKLTVFSSEDDPEIMARLLDLCRVIGLKSPPIFLLRALNSSPSGLAFGHLGSYYVVLNGGLIPLFYQDVERFNAIILHELAHLRNKDVDKTYFSLAIVVAFVLVTLVPLFLGNIVSLIIYFKGNLTFVLWQTFSIAIYLPLIYIALASILRSREVYADARVLVLNNSKNALRNELNSLSSSPHRLPARFLGLHPSPTWRLHAFDDPDLLFGLSHGDAFLAGILSTFALRELDLFLSTLLPAKYENSSLYIASLFFSPFVVSVVGLGIWEKVFASQIRGQSLSGFGRSGLSLGAGMLVGIALSLSSFLENSILFTNASLWVTIAFDLLLSTLLLISLFLIFRWVAVGASVWLETVTNPRNLHGMTLFGLLTTGVMISFWIAGFYFLYEFGYEVVFRFAVLFAPALQRLSEFESLGLSLYTESIMLSITLLGILFIGPMLLFIVIWIFPLLSRLRKSRTSVQHVFIEEQETAYLPAKVHSQLRPFVAFLAGLIVAIGFLVIVTLLRVALHFLVDAETRATPQWLVNFRIIQIGLAIFVQVLLTIILSASIKALGWAHGLLAALVAGLLMAIGMAILIEIADCIPILQLGKPFSCANFFEADFQTWIGQIAALGWFFSLVPAFITFWIGNLFRKSFSRPSPA